jgi:site-specific DNA-methyltransferase (adenine-specific)
LAADHIASWSKPGDVVLDPFCGSGTTCKMAKRAERYYVGIEVCPEYADMARQRVNVMYDETNTPVRRRQVRRSRTSKAA